MSRFTLIGTALILTAAAATPARAVDVVDLWAEVTSNVAAFKQNHVGKAMTVTGLVSSINVEVTPGTVGLAERREGGGSTVLYCYINAADKARIASIARGKAITVSGTMAGVGPSGMWMRPCTFQ